MVLEAWCLLLVACGFLSQSIEQIVARQFVAALQGRRSRPWLQVGYSSLVLFNGLTFIVVHLSFIYIDNVMTVITVIAIIAIFTKIDAIG